MLPVKAMVVEEWVEKKEFESCCDDAKIWIVFTYLFGFLQKQSLRQKRLRCKQFWGEMTPPSPQIRVMKNIYSNNETGKESIKVSLPLLGSAP